jgi:hypothetical protein
MLQEKERGVSTRERGTKKEKGKSVFLGRKREKRGTGGRNY